MPKISFAFFTAVGAGVVALAAPPAFAGVIRTISSGTVTFIRSASSFDSTPDAGLTGVSVPGTQDHLYESGWAFRVAGDGQETFFGVPNTESYVGDHSDIHWNDVGARGLFSATEHSAVFGFGPGGGVAHVLTIVNLSPANALNVHIFHMADIDLLPMLSDDRGTLDEWLPHRVIGIDDPGFNFAYYVATPSAAAYLARPSGAADVGALLADSAVTSFDDTGLPFGPADLTAGYDFPFVLSPSGEETATVYIAVNFVVPCDNLIGIFCDGLEIGNRSVWSSSVP